MWGCIIHTHSKQVELNVARDVRTVHILCATAEFFFLLIYYLLCRAISGENKHL